MSASQVFPHLETAEIKQVLREIKRILKPDGVFIVDLRNIYSPFSWWAKIKIMFFPRIGFGPGYRPHFLSERKMTRIFHRSGARIENRRGIDFFRSSVIFRLSFSPPYRICILSADSPYNTFSDGYTVYSQNLGKNLRNLGCKIFFFGFSKKVKGEKVIVRDNLTYWCLPDKNYRNIVKHFFLTWSFIKRYRKLKKEFGIDVIHGQGGYALPLIFIKNDIVKVATLHGPEPFWETSFLERKIREFFGRIIYPRLNGLVIISHAVKNAASRHYFIKKTILRIINTGTDSPRQPDFKKGKPGKQNSIDFIAFGRPARRKNFPALIKAFEILKTRKKNVSLTIYGPGEKMYPGITKPFTPQERLLQRVKEADIFVLPSLAEGMPSALM
ncbi:MAG: glycosyltransferase, partial [Candidatus Subteraquimicrobiales bacterium]|nr:glycosyltransferase [Candidatus Subteraquimicrobiales bacterium]